MPKIHKLSPHIANLIAAGEVVERPASVVKELLENAVDAGATKITVEIRDGGMTFLRLTDNGCGMAADDAKTAFLRHATSKLRTEEDLAAIFTFGFRGEALAAIASVSRIDIMTKTPGSLAGTSLHLEAGDVTEESEVGCPDGTTIIVRDLFFNTPARMKFMKSDTYEGGRVAAAVQLQALAHPEVSITLIRDGKQILSTPGTGGLEAAVYCIYGRECAQMIRLDSRWEDYRLTGYVSKPTDARPSRNLQTFFVNGRPVKSKIMIAALEEAYRNQIMVGKFPACVLHLELPANTVDVNVHPAKTEVKFLREKQVFDCIHYGVLGALNKTPDRPQMQFNPQPAPAPKSLRTSPQTGVAIPKDAAATPKKDTFFRTMTAEEYKTFSQAVQSAPQPKPEAAVAAAAKVTPAVRETVMIPRPSTTPEERRLEPVATPAWQSPAAPQQASEIVTVPSASDNDNAEEMEQTALPMPEQIPWRLVGELYNAYILVEQGEDAFLIDKHAAHERILFEKLKANQEDISSQMLLTPVTVRLEPAATAELLSNQPLLAELGFAVEEFGAGTLLLRQIPMDLSPDMAAEAVEALSADLMRGRREEKSKVRDEILHTVACKAAIKAGWKNDEAELLALVKQVMSNEDLKYCPHGRPICITLSKKQLEKQFRRTN